MNDLESIPTADSGGHSAGTTKWLDLMPQQFPFRFVDRILEIDDSHVVTEYTFRKDEYFYRGHFPGLPITPGVILLEAMAQCALVLQGLYLLEKQFSLEDVIRFRMLFTDSKVEWRSVLLPGEKVIVRSELLAWRALRLKAAAVVYKESGAEVAIANLSGVAKWDVV